MNSDFGTQSEDGDNERSDYVQVLINGKYKDGNGGLSLAWTNANTAKSAQTTVNGVREQIHAQATNLRHFDKAGGNFDKVYLINDPDSQTLIFKHGHNGVLLKKDNGSSLLFSYWPEPNAGDWTSGWVSAGINCDGILHFAAFTSSDGTNNVLSGNASNAVGLYWRYGSPRGWSNSDGNTYDNKVEISVTNDEGVKIAAQGANVFVDPGRYGGLYHQCSDVANDILNAADKGMAGSENDHGFPNELYKATKTKYGQ
jgi:hypothetical protein